MTDPNLPEQPNAAVPPVPPAAPAYGAPQAPAAPAYGAPAYAAPASSKTNVLAIVSLVSAFFISLVAVITGHIALGQIKKTGEQGRGLAIAGLVLGYIGLVVGLIWIIAVIVIAAAGGFSTSYSY